MLIPPAYAIISVDMISVDAGSVPLFLKETTLRTPSYRHTIARYFALLLLPLFLASPLRADEPQEPLRISTLLQKGLAELVELDVSLATGTPKALKRAPSVATVITAADIEAMGAVTLDEALEAVPGIHVLPSGSNLFSSNFVIRGITSTLDPQVLLLVNGQPVRTNNNGSKPQTFRMPASMISRIEVIRGPGSAVLGADAFAGAVNVITKDAGEIDGTNAGIRMGSFRTEHVWAQHGGVYDGWEVSWGAEYQKAEGDRDRIISSLVSAPGHSAEPPGPLDTTYEVVDSNLLVRKGAWSFRMYHNQAFDNGHGPGINQAHAEESYSRSRWTTGALAWQRKDALPGFDVSATLSGSYYKGENYLQFFPGSVLNMVGNPGAVQRNGGLELTGLYRGWTAHRLRLVGGAANYDTDTSQKKNYGPGITNQYGPLVDISDTPYVFLGDHSRRLLYAALQDEWSFAKEWELTAGVRYDRYSDFGSAVTPRLALVWSATPELTSKLLYGRAFRPPAFGELYNQNNPATLGNSGLKPEEMDTVELAFDYQPAKTLKLGINVFEYRVKGLIDYVQDPAPATTRTAQNVNDQDGNGFELEADWLATDSLRIHGNYSYQRSRDAKTDHAVPDVPGRKIWAGVDWGFLPRWSADVRYLRVEDRRRGAADPRPEIGDYDLVNLILRRKNIMSRADLALAVRNAFDADAREPAPSTVPADYPMEGRSVWAELRYFF